MTLELAAEPVPLYWAENRQVIRIEGTRVRIDSIVYLFKEEKQSAEQIAEEYPSVGLDKIYAVIAYYLRHKEAVDAYIAEGQRAGAEIRRRAEADPKYRAFVERFLADRERNGGSAT